MEKRPIEIPESTFQVPKKRQLCVEFGYGLLIGIWSLKLGISVASGNLPELKFFKPSVRSLVRYAVAASAGLVLAMAFPKFGVAGLAWLAPALLLGSAMGERGGAAFRFGWVGGVSFH